MSRPGRAAWAAVLALPALAFGARLLLAARDEDRSRAPERKRSLAAVGPTTWECDGGAFGFERVVARLAPLHADPTRQAFEAGTLRGRVDGLDGEPYRLQIAVQRGDADEGLRLDPLALRVVDDAGTALVVPELETGGAPDPIATLLRPPAPVGPGEQASFLLFGRAPGAGARLVDAAGETLPLTPGNAPAGGADLPIASVDRTARASDEGGQ